MKSYILLFVTLTQANSFGQDQPPEPASERVRGYDLVERYAEQISQRAASPERQAVRKQIEDEFQLRLERFYKDHPRPLPKPPVSSQPAESENPVSEQPRSLETVAAERSAVDNTETVTVAEQERLTLESNSTQTSVGETRESIKDPQLQPASAETVVTSGAEKMNDRRRALQELADDLGQLEQQLLELRGRMKQLEVILELDPDTNSR